MHTYTYTYTYTHSYAIVMSSLVGESLACGNLGIIGSQKGDVKTAKACMERHLKLATALKVPCVCVCVCVCMCVHDIKSILGACNSS